MEKLRTRKHFMWLNRGWGNIYKYNYLQPFKIKVHKSNQLWFEFQLLRFGFDIGYKIF